MKPEGKREAQPNNLGKPRESRLCEWMENDASDELAIQRIRLGKQKCRLS